MTVRALRLSSVEGRRDFLPHAILSIPVHEATRLVDARTEQGSDHFDDFDEAAALEFEDGLPFVVMHYKGHPEGTATVYLPPHIESLKDMSAVTSAILLGLGLNRQALMWQRSDDPDL